MSGEIYNRKVYDDKYHIKNFLLSYKGLVQVKKLKESPGEYIKLLNSIDGMLGSADFNRNSLFVCNKNIPRELFLVGFSRIKKIRTYYYCNMIELFDIWWGNKKSDNINIAESEIMYSEQDITQGVLCIYINKDMYSVKSDKIINSVITSRSGKCDKEGNELLTWIFFYGEIGDTDAPGFSQIKSLFSENVDEGFQIINLNGNKVTGSKPSSVAKKSSGNSGIVNSDLDDMY